MIRSVLHSRGATQNISPDAWAATIADLKIKAVIFDCDGTLVESAQAHMCAMQAAAKEQGKTISDDWYQARTGLDRRTLFEAIGKTDDGGFDVDRAITASIAAYQGFLDLVTPVPEVVGLALSLRAQSIPIAVVTNAERSVANLSLAQIGLQDVFQALICISDGYKPKPSPQMYQVAMKRLGARPEETLIFEDSAEGVEAAIAADAHIVRIIGETDVML